MSSIEALKNGDLAQALTQLQNDVRKQPADAKHRVYLFQLLSVLGQWDRALTQLNVARDLSAEALAMAQTYQEVLHCEALRARVFAGERSPMFFGEPEPWMALLWQAHLVGLQGQLVESQRLRSEAFEAATALPGELWLHAAAAETADDEAPGIAFEWISDADSRLGPVLEAVVNGRYYWLPWTRVRRVEFERPVDLRDLVWLPAHFEWDNGGEAVGFVPSRYPGSENNSDDLVRLARMTNWSDQGEGIYHGLGQRMLTTDVDEYPLFSLRRIVWAAPPAE